jgi:hypothetical protein
MSEKHFISQIPMATGGGHAPGFAFCWATIKEIVKSSGITTAITFPMILNAC